METESVDGSSYLSFLNPVLGINQHPAKPSVVQYNELGGSLKTVFILGRIEEARGTIRNMFLEFC